MSILDPQLKQHTIEKYKKMAKSTKFQLHDVVKESPFNFLADPLSHNQIHSCARKGTLLCPTGVGALVLKFSKFFLYIYQSGVVSIYPTTY